MRGAIWFGSVLILLASLAHAAPNSPQRVRAFARLPDWTGLWETESSKAITNPSGTPAGDARQYFKLAGHPPYNPEWEQRYQATLSDRAAMAARFNTFKGCGEGSPAYLRSFPNIMEEPMVFEVVVTPGETLFVMDHGEVRHIYTDGRPHPGTDDLWPTPLGDSVGHWSGETLVIDTIARTAGPISMWGLGDLSEQAHFSERVRSIAEDTIEDRLTIEDPVSLMRPWTVTLRFTRVPDLNRFIPFDCEGDQNPVGSKPTIMPPPPSQQPSPAASPLTFTPSATPPSRLDAPTLSRRFVSALWSP